MKERGDGVARGDAGGEKEVKISEETKFSTRERRVSIEDP